MGNKDPNKLTKKHSFIEVFFKTVGVPIIFVVLAIIIGVGFYLNKELMLTVLKYILYVVAGIFALTVFGVVLLGVMTLFSFLKARFKSYLNVRYLPVSIEEIQKLDIHTIDEYFKYIKEFLEISYTNYLWFFTLNVDEEEFTDDLKFKKTSTIVPKFICKEIINTIKEYNNIQNDFIEKKILKDHNRTIEYAILNGIKGRGVVFKNIKKILCPHYGNACLYCSCPCDTLKILGDREALS